MAESAVRELEQAAQIVLAPPNIVTSEQRHAAESIFMNFRKSSMPYNMCRHILENCKNEYVLFQAATTIKEAVVSEWTLLKPSDVESLRTYLLHYVTQNVGLQSYVREQILQAVAVIFKRGTVDERYTDREALFTDVTQLISSGNHTMQLVACSILTALLNEYSSTTRSSSVGLPWEFHCCCKVTFEQTDLKKVFTFSLQVLQELEKIPSPLSREVTAVFNRFLAITEQVLSWEFLPKHIPKRLAGTFLGNQNVSFKPPPCWRDVVLNKELVQMLAKIHQKVRYNSEMAHHSLMCLSQLASVNGQIFPDRESKATFLTNYIETFLHMISSTQLQDYEALGIANIINNLVMFYPTSVLVSLNKDLLLAFLQSLSKLTCNFCQAAAHEDSMQKEDTLFLEAFEKTLTAWTSFLNDSADLPDNVLQGHATEIFNTYLQCHLSAPDGTRSTVSDGGQADVEEYEELDGDDRTRYKDQLCCVGLFGRHIPQHALPLLSRLLEERISRLNGQLQRIQQCRTMSPGGAGIPNIDTQVTDSINEDINWLILISANVLTDDCEGETPMIPSEIMCYSINQVDKVNIDTTLKLLASPGNSLSDIPGAEHSSDTVVRLVSSVLRLCEVEKKAVHVNLASQLSPEVSGTCMWFLTRWVPAYLLPNENYYTQDEDQSADVPPRIRKRRSGYMCNRRARALARRQWSSPVTNRSTDALCVTIPGNLSPDVSFRSRMNSYPLHRQHQISSSLVKAFGKDSEGGQWTVSYLLDKILSNLVTWTSEAKLLEDTLELLLSMVEKKDRCDYVIKCDSLWKLVKDFSANQQQFDILPATCKRLLCKALVLAGSSSFENGNKEEYWKLNVHSSRGADGEVRLSMTANKPTDSTSNPDLSNLSTDPGARLLWEVLHSLHDHYDSIIQQPEFAKRAVTESEMRRKVISLLECLSGVAEASRADNVSIIFQFLHPAMVDSVIVLDVLHMYEEVVQLVLELFNSVVNRQICYLNDSSTNKLYEASLSMMQVYSKHNVGRHTVSKDMEEEQYQDILIMLQLLTHTLSKDFIDFGDKDDSAGCVSAADVVLYGLNIVVPLMTDELLKFPALCNSYMCLLTYMAEIYPEKVCALPDHLLKIVLASEEMGIAHYSGDIVKLSLEFLTSIAAHVHQHNMMDSLVHCTMAHFLQLVFNMLLLETFDMELLETASATFFTLICCHQDHYQKLVTELLEKHSDPNVHQRLVDAFNTLTDDILLQVDRQNRIKFRMKFDDFLVNVRGLLCIK